MSVNQSAECIGEVYWTFSGPSVKSGRAAKRGFTVAFSLLNADYQNVAVDGKLEVIIRHRNNNPFSKQRFFFTIPAGSFGLASHNCLVKCDKPVLADDNFWTVELWFTTSDGRRLYGKSQ